MKNEVYVRLDFIMANKQYDCLLDINKTLLENISKILCLIKKDIEDIYSTSYQLLIYEKYTNNLLSLDTVIKELNIYDGITLIIY